MHSYLAQPYSQTLVAPAHRLGPTSAPWWPGFLPGSPLSSALRDSRYRTCLYPQGFYLGLFFLFPYTQPDKVPSVTCPLTIPLLSCLTSSAGQGLRGEQGTGEREGSSWEGDDDPDEGH